MSSEQDRQKQKNFEQLVTFLIVLIGICVVAVFSIIIIAW